MGAIWFQHDRFAMRKEILQKKYFVAWILILSMTLNSHLFHRNYSTSTSFSLEKALVITEQQNNIREKKSPINNWWEINNMNYGDYVRNWFCCFTWFVRDVTRHNDDNKIGTKVAKRKCKGRQCTPWNRNTISVLWAWRHNQVYGR